MIASLCWQSVTPFEALGGHDSGEPDKVGNVPEPCRVPLFNLKTREVKILDFGKEGLGIV